MTYPLSHKTVFVLDQTAAFSQSCEQIEIESVKSSVSQQAGFIPLPPVDKSIWTSATESVLEYCRIVWDIFPTATEDLSEHRLIRFVVCNERETNKVLNTWNREQQSAANLANGFALAGRPESHLRSTNSSKGRTDPLRNGIRKALEILSETTEAQQKVQGSDDAAVRLVNRGRIVCLTHAEDPTRFTDDLLLTLQKELAEVNSAAATSVSLASISHVEVDVVCCFSDLRGHPTISTAAAEMTARQLSPTISYTSCSVLAGGELSKKLLWMALRHFDLASTTVTGIPMKEEQNASSSANYDVELFHKASAHWRLLTSDVFFSEDPKLKSTADDMAHWMPQTLKEGCDYKTITLKWCTPRGSSADLHNCTALARVTPTDVNSRPSSCLTNFLLSGRSVMLEMPRRSGSKILSHMLTSHGGEIFIHTLNISRSVLEDPPSISEGPGGRVTDYRIPDFGVLMKSNRLAPYYGEVNQMEEQPLEKMRERVSRFSKFCPMTISATTIFNMEAVEPLQHILVQEELTEENLAECRKIIYALLAMEHKGDALPVPMIPTSSGGKAKTLKKDDQYKLMFGELERFVAAHCRTERHHKVLDCLLESRNRPASERPATATERRDDNKVELDVALRELDRYSAMTEREKADFNAVAEASKSSRSSRERSPSPAPAVAKRPKIGGGGGISLLDMWTKSQKENSSTKGRHPVPFVGMRSLGEKARLYLSLDRKEKDQQGPPHGAGAS